MRMAQHNCKVKAEIQGTGRKMTITRPLDFFNRPTIMDLEGGDEMGQAQDIRIYNYAGWNHCPAQYQGLQDFGVIHIKLATLLDLGVTYYLSTMSI